MKVSDKKLRKAVKKELRKLKKLEDKLNSLGTTLDECLEAVILRHEISIVDKRLYQLALLCELDALFL